MLENDDLATSTCVGTPCYLSPELVQGAFSSIMGKLKEFSIFLIENIVEKILPSDSVLIKNKVCNGLEV